MKNLNEKSEIAYKLIQYTEYICCLTLSTLNIALLILAQHNLLEAQPLLRPVCVNKSFFTFA